MDMKSGMQQLAYARQTPFRDAFKGHVGKKIPPTLSDEAIALVFAASTDANYENERILDKLTRTLGPENGHSHFEVLLKMETERGPFFKRFALFTKTAIDGLLVGFGTDEMYYVLVAWDNKGCDLWKPECDLYDRPVFA